MKQSRIFILGFVVLSLLFILTGSIFIPQSEEDKVRQFTRANEFDFTSWTIDATLIKITQLTTNIPLFLDLEQQKRVLTDYLHIVEEIDRIDAHIRQLFSDPQQKNPEASGAVFLLREKKLIKERNLLAPLAEPILQLQIGTVLKESNLATLGQPLPPILYHTTQLPYALIVSPRNIIQQTQNISLNPDITLDTIIQIEDATEKGLDVSALVVPVGGIGTYPTMVMNTSDLSWLIEVVSHEWTHNYLTLRPLGMNYETNNELRTMNETTANIAGKEIANLVLQTFYPELTQKPGSSSMKASKQPGEAQPPFDFRAEMHTTRVTTDQLLLEGKIEQAEQYMEMRRKVFWENGYMIRKLNQAYFAFYGAYADIPGGSAGEDPVGPAVRALRQQSRSLAEFLSQIAAMTSFTELQAAVGNP